ncbi:hypothetical protein RB195_003912 [Necator americanus]|uniref:Zasp-like motif domain-containing protein n=1 Tax=Necator americanus TaxID=51031 RepID=A0ABR1DQS3_NECAM
MACGPKCMAFLIFISLWGIIFLSILGGLYYNQSVGLFENLPGEDKNACSIGDWDCRKKHIVDLYHQNAYNCWIAAAGYAVVALLAVRKRPLEQLEFQMREVCVADVWVPAGIESHFRRETQIPFSYTKPNVKFLLRRAKLKMPKVLPLVKKESMAQPVHLQYNSPMPIYSRETAEEQYQQQIGSDPTPISTPIPMPSGDKHFDPSKSATLKFIKEGDEGHFGEHFFEQIASVEAPKQIPHQEPEWALYAREKSERARSRTPADPAQHHTPSMTPTHERHRPASYHERPRETTPREFVEKSRTFTHTNQPRWGPSYSQTLPFRRRVHSETRDTPGYEYGGMDFTKGMHFSSAPYDYTYEIRRSRADDTRSRFRPGYEFGGSDFGTGYVAGGPYHGHGPDPPRLRPHYSADPRSACNSYYAPNVDEVDANLLVGDTISNQKIRHEVRHINQNEFGTSFAPPSGFKRDHITVRRQEPPPGPVTFSLSANKARYGGSTGSLPTLSRERDFATQRQFYDDKEVTVQTLLNDDVLRKRERETTPVWHDHSLNKHEAWRNRSDPRLNRNQVFTNEPNWSRTVQQRRNAWEQKAYDTEARVNLPASAKVPPPQPPAWHNKAAKTHNVWQHAADTMSGMTQSYEPQRSYEPSYYQSGGDSQQYRSQYHEERHMQSQPSYQHSYQQRHEQQQQQQQQQQQHHHHQPVQYATSAPVQGYTSSQHTESHTTHSIPAPQTYITSGPIGGSNAEMQVNTGYNTNQIDYVRDHFDKYRAGPRYPGSHHEQSSQSNYSKSYSSSAQHQNVTQQSAIPLPPAGQTYSFSTETRSTAQGSGPVSNSANYQQSSYNQSSYSSEKSKPAPFERSHEASSYHKSVSMDTRSIPTAPPASLKGEKIGKMFASDETRNIPIHLTSSMSEASRTSFQKSSSSKEETRSVPIKPTHSEFKESYQRSESSKQETTRSIPVHSVGGNLQESHSTSFSSQTATQPLSVTAPQNYTTSSSYHSETHTNQPPVTMHSPGGSYRSYQSSHYSKQEKTTSTTTSQPPQTVIHTTNLPITKTTSYNYQQQSVPIQQPAPQVTQSSFTSHTEKKSTTGGGPPPQVSPMPPAQSNYEAQYHRHREETRREETSRPVSQLSQYSEQKHYKRNVEEKTETRTIPAATSIITSDANKSFTTQDVFNKREEMNETLPLGSISNTHANTQGEYRDVQGHDVSYKRETQTAVDPGKEYALLKEEEKRVVETDLEPGVISRHVTTKYYKKKTVTDTTTTTTPQ